MVPLNPGVYEHLRTHRLDALLRQIADQERISARDLDPEDAHEVLARHLVALIRRALPIAGKPDKQLKIANRIAGLIAELVPEAAADAEAVVRGEELLAIASGRTLSGQVSFPERPLTPLTASALLMNGRGQPSIGHELRLEFASANRVDLLCAFVKWNGIRVLEEPIKEFVAQGGLLRVITGTYLGATDLRAVERLAELGAEIKISYETKMTRLHAKAWLFHRGSDLHTAYVGSSNLSRTALSHGLEWNVRLANAEQPHLIEAFARTFEDYWNDPVFEEFDPTRDSVRLAHALTQERAGRSGSGPILDEAYLDVVPFPYQREILDQLAAEREVHGHKESLVVMATGTGKTVVAALDYRRLVQAKTVDSLLFVAHREEILHQSRQRFGHVLRDMTFGEFFVGGNRPAADARHVFASIQSLHSRGYEDIDPATFDMVIVDEFHHAEADTYRRLLDHIRPKVLLGLTATPERADGRNVLEWFGGRKPIELRLWEAMERGYLAPFQYFGIHDGVDLSDVPFKRNAGYDTAQLAQVYTGNDQRVALVLETLRRKVTDRHSMCAIGFCVSIAHARFMAEHFSRAGIPAVAVTSDPISEDRKVALRRLSKREINVIFAVDIFNEGVDIPEIDTVLFLRPTDSATIFLQQLGRGLRLAEGKDCLTVLDFVGQQHRNFRFDRRLRALTGVTRGRLEDEVARRFPSLPPGCVIDLDRDVHDIVLRNVRQSIQLSWKELSSELRKAGDIDLPVFLSETGLDVDDLYRHRPGWLALRRAAGYASSSESDTDSELERAFGRMLHIDDPERLDYITKVLEGYTLRSERDRRLLAMLDAVIWKGTQPVSELEARLGRLLAHRDRCDELRELVPVLRERIARITAAIGDTVPLRLHGRYTKNEVLAAYGVDKPATWPAGVRWVPEHQADLFFVTINKVEGHYSPTTMYHDLALDPEHFQWESQSTTGVGTPTANRYINHVEQGSSVHLFVRESKRDEGLGAPPYLYAGPMRYESHERDKPIRFVWKLEHALPADVFHYARATAG
jgi:superfamily II DNA or RNA helicase/HKD family nuclease